MISLWPDLPDDGFITGRPATADDVREGKAIFHTNGTGGDAAAVAIPQYALWSEEVGEAIPVVLIQAEHAPQEGTILVGLRKLTGEGIVAVITELELLGSQKPE